MAVWWDRPGGGRGGEEGTEGSRRRIWRGLGESIIGIP